jgi:GR25 family glycosyltransferase involved in LPS biosynthesis
MEKLPKYVINLERDKHKLKRFNTEMEKQNIPYEIWRGSIINNIADLNNFKNKHSFTKGTTTVNFPGNVGSAFAHLSLWKYCLKQPSDYFMIFEDNCVLKDNFVKNVNYFLNKIKKFDFFNLNVIRPHGFTNDNILFKYKSIKEFPYPPPNTWMSSYIISKRLMYYILNISKNINYDKMPIDKIVMFYFNEIETINYYSINTNILTTHIEQYTDTRKILNKKKNINVKSFITETPLNGGCI